MKGEREEERERGGRKADKGRYLKRIAGARPRSAPAAGREEESGDGETEEWADGLGIILIGQLGE